MSIGLLLGILTAALGKYAVALPAATEDRAVVPMWRLLAMGAGVLPALALHSSLADLEQQTSTIRKMERRYLAGVATATGLAYLAAAAVTLPITLIAVLARSIVGWLGLSLLSGRFLGWRLSWGAPIMIFAVLVYWGTGGDGQVYEWWEFSARPHSDSASMALCLVLFAVGVCAQAMTPWRIRRLTSVPQAGRRGSRPLRRHT
ncbi:hypothetical protein [Pilimelia anulata]|uniref:hypothetical protein n=1 Tax=Pilimelia anulata TaxID=53371 RepID=UPI00166E4199|nr:hypothetical protein [Pilimelia anulata]